METKNIINIPEGFEVDKEQSTERKIVLKKIENRVRSWEEYCEKMRGKDSYWFKEVEGEIEPEFFSSEPYLSEFEDKETLEAFIAFSKLLKLHKAWVGDWQPDWKTYKNDKYIIATKRGELDYRTTWFKSSPMCFPTKGMRKLFALYFRELLEKAKPLL